MNKQNTQRILVVDDERNNLIVLSDLLKTDYDIILAKNGVQALQRAQVDNPPDLILLDVMMPEMDGYEVLRRLKASDQTKDIPIIFITALDSLKNEELGLTLGALDYITKPFHPSIVKARVRNHMDLVRKHKLLAHLAHLDGLTELPNRRSYEEALEREWRRCIRNKVSLSLCIMDVDFFKLYNDTYGHAAGDYVLKLVADILLNSLKRSADFTARFGGEEFVLLLPDTDKAGAFELAESIRETIEAMRIPHSVSPISDVLTVSIGGTTEVPNQQDGSMVFVNLADSALYKAKQDGRNRVIWND